MKKIGLYDIKINVSRLPTCIIPVRCSCLYDIKINISRLLQNTGI